MKKYFILAAAAVAALASCTKSEDPQNGIETAEENAIAFTYYNSTSVTKGSVQTSDPITGYYDATSAWVPGTGIGVFAFYQPANNGVKSYFNSKKYATPDYMYNQNVKQSNSGTWEYAPVKYWPNNEHDQVSFFAYAPYDKDVVWEDMGVSTDINATKLSISFPIQDVVKAQEDYLLAAPQINKTKPSVTDKINFTFNHALSQINLYAAAQLDLTAGSPYPWTDTKTVITIDKVEFKGLAERVTFPYTIAADGTISVETVETDGTQDIVMTAKNDFENNTSAVWTDDQYHQFNKATSVMFVAPQTLSDVIITYTVKTTDSGNAANNSEITNVITASLSSLTLVSGSSYNINFLIGMTSVKVEATIGNWTPAGDTTVEVPENN